MGAPAVGKCAGDRWKKMTEKEKAPYEKKAKDAKDAFEKAMEEFKAQGGVAGKRRAEKAEAKRERADKRARKANKDPNKPKKPQSAYWLWLGENRAAIQKEVGKGSVTEVAKRGGEKWKALSDVAKAPFEKKAAELKKKYDKEMEEYKKNNADAGDDDEEEEEDGDASA